MVQSDQDQQVLNKQAQDIERLKRNQAELQKKNASLTTELRQVKKQKGIKDDKPLGKPSKPSLSRTQSSKFSAFNTESAV